MFRPTGYEHSSTGIHTSCICDMCTNNNCDNCHFYRNIGYNVDRIIDSKELYDSEGIDAVTENYGVEVNTYTLYFKDQKLASFDHKINISDIDIEFGISVDYSIIAIFYYNEIVVGKIDTGKKYSDFSFSEFADLKDNFESKASEDLKLEKTTKKELVKI